MSLFPVILLYAIWSGVFSLGKLALQYSPPIFLTGFRMVVAALLLLAYIAIRNPSDLRVSWRQLLPISLLALFSIYLTNILEFWGLQYLSAGKACFIYSLSPFFAALFSYLHFGERMAVKKWLGLLIGFVGIAPVLYQQTSTEEAFSLAGFLSWPALAIVGAALASVYGWVLLRLSVKNQSTSPLVANSFSMLLGGMLALAHSSFVDTWNPTPVAPGKFEPFLLWTLAMTVVSNLFCYNLYAALLKKFTATFLSFMGLLSPLFASIHGYIFLNEPISWAIIGSTSLISVGLWFVYSAELKQGYITSKPVANG